MTPSPKALSLEFHASFLDELESCLRVLARYHFRTSRELTFDWVGRWADAEEALAVAPPFATSAGDPLLYGDVYGRRC